MTGVNMNEPYMAGRQSLANDGGNGAAAKKLGSQNARHRRLPFTAWLFLVCYVFQ
jgi:hypothetical protein